MVNAHRGEIEATFDGQSYRLVLTLGALAELESAFGDSDMVALTGRFESGRLSARDCIRIIGAGLRGAGTDVGDEAVARMTAKGGATGYVDVVARLLTATFGTADSGSSDVNASEAGTRVASGPFVTATRASSPGGT